MEQLEALAVADLATMASPYNPREISEHDFAMLKHSLGEYGQVENLVCNRRSTKRGWGKRAKPVIVGGHQRVRAAAEVGVEELAVAWVDLDKVQERNLNLILNRTQGAFERETLQTALRELAELGGDLAMSGFTTSELDKMLGELGGQAPPSGFQKPDEGTTHTCPQCGYQWT